MKDVIDSRRDCCKQNGADGRGATCNGHVDQGFAFVGGAYA